MEMPAKPARGKPAARVGKRVQIDAEESMAECIAEVNDVTAGLEAEERDTPVPATAAIPDTVLRLRLDQSKKKQRLQQ
jgi:hypothetical protein